MTLTETISVGLSVIGGVAALIALKIKADIADLSFSVRDDVKKTMVEYVRTDLYVQHVESISEQLNRMEANLQRELDDLKARLLEKR